MAEEESNSLNMSSGEEQRRYSDTIGMLLMMGVEKALTSKLSMGRNGESGALCLLFINSF